MTTRVYLFGLALAAVVVGAAALFYYSTLQEWLIAPTSAQRDMRGEMVAGSVAGSVEYRNQHYRFAVTVPEEFSVNELAEAGGSRTITFEDEDGERGFQVFVLPYADDQVTQSRIQKDTHGTAKGAPQEIVVGNGIRALTFESSDPRLGHLREVWILQGGFLYEVTSYKAVDDWLAELLKSWRFL